MFLDRRNARNLQVVENTFFWTEGVPVIYR